MTNLEHILTNADAFIDLLQTLLIMAGGRVIENREDYVEWLEKEYKGK